jgi:hypothetical protein
VVTVGNNEWLFWKSTPSARMRAIVGAVSGDTAAARSPSATNSSTFCGCAMARREDKDKDDPANAINGVHLTSPASTR